MEKSAIHKMHESQLKLELTKINFGKAYANSQTIKSLLKDGKLDEAYIERQRLWDEAEVQAMEHPTLKP
jgi:hypothetical protein